MTPIERQVRLEISWCWLESNDSMKIFMHEKLGKGTGINYWNLEACKISCLAVWFRWVLESWAHYIAKGWSIACPWALPLFRYVPLCHFLPVRDNQDTGSVKIYRSSTRNNGVSLGSFFEKGLLTDHKRTWAHMIHRLRKSTEALQLESLWHDLWTLW